MKILKLSVIGFVLAAAPAFATDLTFFGAAQHQGRLTLQSATQNATSVGSFNPTTFGVFGLRVGHGRMFGGEHTFAYAPNFIDSRLKAVITSSDVLIQAPLPKIKPYATAGVGAIFTFTDSPATLSDIGTKFALNYGGGVKVLPAGPVGLRFDVRGYSIPGVKFNLTSLPLGSVTTQSQTLNTLEIGAGVIFSFGE